MARSRKLYSRIAAVFQLLQSLPPGRVVSYGVVAKRCGLPCARNVGWILRQNRDAAAVPCFKVVLSDGRLTNGYKFGGAAAQRRLLKDDGVVFLPDGRVTARALLR